MRCASQIALCTIRRRSSGPAMVLQVGFSFSTDPSAARLPCSRLVEKIFQISCVDSGTLVLRDGCCTTDLECLRYSQLFIYRCIYSPSPSASTSTSTSRFTASRLHVASNGILDMALISPPNQLYAALPYPRQLHQTITAHPWLGVSQSVPAQQGLCAPCSSKPHIQFVPRQGQSSLLRHMPG